MRLTKVVHCRMSPYDIYIGRPSKWGNPFIIGQDGDRLTVIKKFRDWIVNQRELMIDIGALKGKTLGCWCYPLSCHGDILAELADSCDLRDVAI